MDDINVIVKFVPEDVLSLREDWSVKQCEDFLSRNSKQMQDRLIELGWQVMQDLIDYDESEEKTNIR